MKKDYSIAYLNLGALALNSGHDQEAVWLFTSALKVRDDLVEAYIGLGLAFSRTENHAGMVAAFRRAIQLNQIAVRKWTKKSIPGPHVWLSFTPEYAHIKGKMAEFLRKQDEADALARLGAADISSGRYTMAVNTLEYCLTLTPHYEAAVVLLAIAYLSLESREAGSAAKAGLNSILWKTFPKLAEILFINP